MASRLTYITSRDNPLLVRLRKLARHPADYRKHGQILLEGEHLCVEWAARGGAPARVAIVAGSAWQAGRFIELAQTALATAIVADAAMAELSTLEAPAPIAFVVSLPTAAAIRAGVPSVVLDRVQDAGNVGSIMRSAAAFGFAQVIALRGTAGLWSAKVLRAAMGAHFGLDVVEGADESALDVLGLPVLGTGSHATQMLAAAPLPWPAAWIFGNEGEGMSGSLAGRCDLVLRIPQPGGQESLNVGAAAAVCMYQSVSDKLARERARST